MAWLAVVATLAVLAPAPANAAHGCRVANTKVVARTSQAVVLFKTKTPYYHYGCYFKKGAVYRLERASEWGSGLEGPITLRGFYVAYVEVTDGPAESGQGGTDMVVRNLITGVVEHSGSYGPWYGGKLWSIRLKANGRIVTASSSTV